MNQEAVPTLKTTSKLPYWLVNVPPEEWPTECPEFLDSEHISEKDRAILSTPDAEYQRTTWEEVKNHIGKWPTDYLCPSCLSSFIGSTTCFVAQELLK